MTSSSAFFAVGLGMPELLMILAILLLLFGGSKLPGLAKGLGQSVKEFKKATKDDVDDDKPVETKKVEPVKTSAPGAN